MCPRPVYLVAHAQYALSALPLSAPPTHPSSSSYSPSVSASLPVHWFTSRHYKLYHTIQQKKYVIILGLFSSIWYPYSDIFIINYVNAILGIKANSLYNCFTMLYYFTMSVQIHFLIFWYLNCIFRHFCALSTICHTVQVICIRIGTNALFQTNSCKSTGLKNLFYMRKAK